MHTYQIFEEEQIFGYKNPKIELRYRANDMRPHLNITQSAKLKETEEAKPTNIAGLLMDGNHLPKGMI
jgi:histone acetyltransferase 1